MSTNITLKRSSVQGKVPVVGDLALGEIAVNTYDGKLFIKKNVDGIESIIDTTPVTNLSLTSNSSTISVNSDTGTDVTILAANSTTAGILSADAQTIAGIKTFSSNTVLTTVTAGLWNGTIIGPTYGGTGQNTLPKAMASLKGFQSIVSAAGTTTLTVTSPETILITGSLTQTIVLPDVTTLSLGWTFNIINNSTQGFSIQSSGLNTYSQTIQPNMTIRIICIAVTGTTMTSWAVSFDGASLRTGFGYAVYGTSPYVYGMLSGVTSITAGTDAQGSGAINTSTDVANIITTAANPSGVTLHTPTAPGRRIFVFNKGTNPVNVYPNTGNSIDALAVNTPISIPVNTFLIFNSVSLTQWYSSLNIQVSTSSLSGTVAPANGGTGVNNATRTITINTGNLTLTADAAGSSVTVPASGILAVTSNKLSAFAATTSSELADVISDETGTGALVFGTAPTFTTSIDGTATFNAFASPTTLTLGYTNTAASTTNISTGVVAAATTKTINIGTGGAASSTTNITLGAAVGGTTTIASPTLTLSGAISANGSIGATGQVLTSNATGVYWSTVSGVGGSTATYNTTIGDGTATSFTVTHSLNKTNIFVSVRDVSTGYFVYPDIRYTSTNAVVLEFVDPPTASQYYVAVIGA